VFWVITYVIKEDIKKFFNSLYKVMFVFIWFALGGALILGYMVY